MGVSTNIYTYYGVKIPYDNELSEAYEEHYENPQAPDILFDDMCGKYIVLGVRLYNSGDMRYGMEDGDHWKEIDLGMLPKHQIEYKEAFKQFYPQFMHLLDKPFKLITFTHYH